MKEIVIKIDEATYHRIVSGFANEDDAGLFADLFKNGTPLPKGHDDLIDRGELLSKIHHGPICNYIEPKDINELKPIIKADKEYEVEVITRGNCMICGKELTEGLFFCKECEDKVKKEGNNHGEEKLS